MAKKISKKYPFLYKGYENRSLDEMIIQSAGEEVYIRYRYALYKHYRILKFHRRCDIPTLKFLRKILYYSKVVSMNTNPGWIIDRPHKYKEIDELVYDKIKEERSSGFSDLYRDISLRDIGPGNCRAMYFNSVPGVSCCGVAPELLYALDGTLKNCLKNEFQLREENYQDRLFSKIYNDVVFLLNEFSMLEFIFSESQEFRHHEAINKIFDRFELELLSKNDYLKYTFLERIIRENDRLITLVHDKEMVAEFGKILFLGTLIDELISRIDFINGMYFSYSNLNESLSQLQKKFNDIKPYFNDLEINSVYLKLTLDSIEEQVKNLLKEKTIISKIKKQLKNILKKNRKNASEKSKLPLIQAEQLANDFKMIANSLRENKRSDPLIGIIDLASNELWRWIFFERQLKEDDSYDLKKINECIDIILEWSKHPWGILGMDDVEFLFRGSFDDDDDEVPKALWLLLDYFKLNLSEYLCKEFGFSNEINANKYFRRFLKRKIIIALLNRTVSRIIIDDDAILAKARKASHIIDHYSAWIFQMGNEKLLEEIKNDLYHALLIFINGNWANQILQESKLKTRLTRNQINELREFSENQSKFSSQFFDIDFTDFDLSEHIDVFPPEFFIFAGLEEGIATKADVVICLNTLKVLTGRETPDSIRYYKELEDFIKYIFYIVQSNNQEEIIQATETIQELLEESEADAKQFLYLLLGYISGEDISRKLQGLEEPFRSILEKYV